MIPPTPPESSSLPRLVIATGNHGKLREMEELLLPSLSVELLSLAAFPGVVPVEENGTTFQENAALKAASYAAQTACCVLADDSGLEVEALDGAPGIHSARYGGPHVSDRDRLRLLLREVAARGDASRAARFVCTVAFADPFGGDVQTWSGVCEGHLALEPAGTGGFGYDPVFVPRGYDRTFGQLAPEIKRSISHRARAIEAALPALIKRFGPP